MSLKHTYKRIPDIADHRDHYFVPQIKTFPVKIDIIGREVPIKDQGQLGSCTGQAAAALVEIETGSTRLSELMAYYGGRKIEGTVRQDSGCMMRDVIKAISKVGICKEPLYPHVITKFKSKPSKKAYEDAAMILPKITSYQRILDLNLLKTALFSGKVVTFGFSVPEYFEGVAVAKGALVRMPQITDKMVGGHEVVAVGYDDTADIPFVWCRNSWGPDWGLDGYFKMDQRWFTDPRRLVDDMWSIEVAI